MDLLSVLDELDDEETAMLFRAIRAYNQLESENEAIRTKAVFWNGSEANPHSRKYSRLYIPVFGWFLIVYNQSQTFGYI